MLRTRIKQNKGMINKKRLTIDHLQVAKNGQVILEFTFCVIVILLMIFGSVKVFHWAGRDLVERRRAHDSALRNFTSPRQQVDPYFYTPGKMNAVWKAP